MALEGPVFMVTVSLKAKLLMVNSMAMLGLFIMMVCIIKANTKTRKNMEEANTFTMMGELKTEIGKMANFLKHEVYR